MSRLTYIGDMAEAHTTTTINGISEHYCEHPGCKEWGGFGFMPSKSTPPRWWCWPHYPYKEPGSTRTGGALPD